MQPALGHPVALCASGTCHADLPRAWRRPHKPLLRLHIAVRGALALKKNATRFQVPPFKADTVRDISVLPHRN